MKRIIFVMIALSACFLLNPALFAYAEKLHIPAAAEENLSMYSSEDSKEPEETCGRSAGFLAGTGLQGIFSYGEAGFMFPRIGGSFIIDLKARYMSSITWATFIDQQTGENASFHPVTAAGIVSFGGYSPMMNDAVKLYGGVDLLFGYTFTPYDDFFYGTSNLLGANLTYGIFGYSGIEYYTSKRSAIFIQAGGGYRGMKLFPDDPDNLYAVAVSWLGSGFGIELGMKFYFK